MQSTNNHNSAFIICHEWSGEMTTYSLLAPVGFNVPVGHYGVGDSESTPELNALLAYFEIDFEPHEGERIHIRDLKPGELPREPSLEELQQIMLAQKEKQ